MSSHARVGLSERARKANRKLGLGVIRSGGHGRWVWSRGESSVVGWASRLPESLGRPG